jgi:hypothetical protein
VQVDPSTADAQSNRRKETMVARLSGSLFRRVGAWVRGNIVQDVPRDIAACEFDCSRERCDAETLATCERRKLAEAAARDQERVNGNGQGEAAAPVVAKPVAKPVI